MAFRITCVNCGRLEHVCGEDLPDLNGFCTDCCISLELREAYERAEQERQWWSSLNIIIWLCLFAWIAGH